MQSQNVMSIDQQILLSLIKKKVNETDTLRLIETILFSFAEQPNKGLPLGNVTSQLFSNIYLNELDQFIKHSLKQRFYIRYCDDFIILHQDREYLASLTLAINNFLKNSLQLFLHPNKIIIRKLRQGIDFLGYVTLPYHRVIRTKTKRRMLRLVNEKNLDSYLGICHHAYANGVKRLIEKKFY